MSESRGELTIEQRLQGLKETLSRYKKGHPIPTPEVVTDLARAIHELGDHLSELNRRLEKLEQDKEQWTTKGWIDPGSSEPRGIEG